MTDPTPLSPTAQAIVTAFDDKYENCGQWDDDWQEQCLAAALRAAADQVVPEPSDTDKALLSLAAIRNHCKVRDRFLAIAAELEGSNA
jgi:hypothetical protein